MLRLRQFLLLAVLSAVPLAGAPIRVLVIDGQNNHAWQQTTPALKWILEQSGRFKVDVATTPAAGKDMSSFQPAFANYQVVLSNYNGDPWPNAVRQAFEKFIKNGGGFVSFHAANNAFPAWVEYNRMIGLGGWGERTESAGPYWFFADGKLASDKTPGRAGSHGQRLPFAVTVVDATHPVTKGLPAKWMHNNDELYDRLRGPGEQMTVLATAHSEPSNKGTGRDEPMLLTVKYGKGRIFHTTLGHDLTAMSCVGFIITLERGTEWAATGKVSIKIPADFPGNGKPSVRKLPGI